MKKIDFEEIRPSLCGRCRDRFRRRRWIAATRAAKHQGTNLTHGEVQRLVAAADVNVRPALMAMAMMGLRSSEVGLVDWEHPTRRGRRLWVAVPRPKQAATEWRPLPARLWAEIGGLQPDHRDHRLGRLRLIRAFRRAAETAGLKNVRLHDLRRHYLNRSAERKAKKAPARRR